MLRDALHTSTISVPHFGISRLLRALQANENCSKEAKAARTKHEAPDKQARSMEEQGN